MASTWDTLYKLNKLNPQAFPMGDEAASNDQMAPSPWTNMANVIAATSERAPTSQEAPISGEPLPNRNINSQDMLNGRLPNTGPDPEIMRQLKEALAGQNESVGAQKALLKKYQEQPTRADLSPLLALSDTWFGGDLQKGYRPPENETDRILGESKLNQGIGSQRKEIIDSLTKIAGQRSNDRFLENLLRQQGREDGLFKEFISGATKDANKVTNEMNQFDSQFGYLEKQFKSGDVRKAKAALSNFARFVNQEKGALSEGDVARSRLPTLETYLAELETKMGGDGKYSEKDITPLLEMISDARTASKDRFGGSLSSLRDAYELRAQAQNFGERFKPGAPGYEIFNKGIQRAEKIAKPQTGYSKEDDRPGEWLKRKRGQK